MHVFFRYDQDTREEYEIAKQYLPTSRFTSTIPEGSLVIGRYSVLPFYQWTEEDIVESRKSRLVNTFSEHEYIANASNWAEDLREVTPAVWKCGWANAPDTEHGWVVKGETNSRKFRWNTHMYAPDRDSLRKVMNRLHEDSLISRQGLIVRPYIPLKTLEFGINNLPITNEWRCFFLGDRLLSHGYYWSIAENSPDSCEGLSVAMDAAKIISRKTNFFVLDIAETETGEWIVIEVNDGQMSGLSNNNPHALYSALADVG